MATGTGISSSLCIHSSSAVASNKSESCTTTSDSFKVDAVAASAVELPAACLSVLSGTKAEGVVVMPIGAVGASVGGDALPSAGGLEVPAGSRALSVLRLLMKLMLP